MNQLQTGTRGEKPAAELSAGKAHTELPMPHPGIDPSQNFPGEIPVDYDLAGGSHEVEIEHVAVVRFGKFWMLQVVWWLLWMILGETAGSVARHIRGRAKQID